MHVNSDRYLACRTTRACSTAYRVESTRMLAATNGVKTNNCLQRKIFLQEQGISAHTTA